jgi:tetrahydromethanopterin S-methyltransferase subunit B
VLVDEQNVMLEASIEMWFKTKVDDDRVVVTIDVCINTVKTLEDLADSLTKSLGEGNACRGNGSPVLECLVHGFL